LAYLRLHDIHYNQSFVLFDKEHFLKKRIVGLIFFSANNGKDVQVSRIFSSVPQKMRKKMFSVHIVKKIESRKVIVLEMIFFSKKKVLFWTTKI